MRNLLRHLVLLAPLALTACLDNNPYPPSEAGRNIYYDTFSEEPKHLDPARSYSSDEYRFMNQIYEPVVQYHYLKRPYQLTTLTATQMPSVKYFKEDGGEVPADASPQDVAKVVYEIKLRSDVQFQEHPCFAKRKDGTYRWHLDPGERFPKIEHPDELPEKGSRPLTAHDYGYQIKRLAHPQLQCPILPLLVKYVDGFEEFHERLGSELARIREERRAAAGVFYNQEADEKQNPIYLDLRKYDMRGLEIVDKLTYRITLKKKYPQFIYWLAMPFFAAVPWEADRFHFQSAASAMNITLNRFPIGTGPFTLAVNKPNYRMVLRRNPNFHDEKFPSEGEPSDIESGLLDDAGKKLPFVEEAVYVLEKEGVPRWNKFLQGYYDTSGIASDVFDQAVSISTEGVDLTDYLRDRGVVLRTSISPITYYYGFNMLDDVVGGYGEKRKKLRQAISIAIDIEEYIQIFLNGRGEPAQGPIPSGIPGYQEGREGINPVVYDWDKATQRPKRKSIEEARRLMAEAGYPNGRDTSGKPLVLFYDTSGGGTGSKPFFDWLRKQFRKINVELQIRSTDYNQFREKVLKGNCQILSWGWHADYPDPENFLFLLHGPQGKVKSDGENASNYDSPVFNKLFEEIENMENSPERMAKIRECLRVVREDAPWVWGYHPKGYGLYHSWYKNAKPMSIGGNTLKYKRVDADARANLRTQWNEPVTWPVWLVLALLVAGTLPAALTIYRRERGAAKS